MKEFVELPKLKEGDQVAIVSPAGDAAGRFPWVLDYGLQQLQSVFKLSPKEYPSTRKVAASHQEKADDLMAAFSDTDNKAILSTIGGFDQIQMLKLLNPKVFFDNPKPFFGSSDNTHIINYLWNLGIPSYYCGSIMSQIAIPGGIPDLSLEFLRHAFFDKGQFEMKSSKEFNEETQDWGDKDGWNKPRKMEPNQGLLWDCEKDREGILWGGCLESMVVKFASGKFLPKDEDLADCILFLETSEEIPQTWAIAYVLMGMGERGYFDRFRAVLFGRPKAWHVFNKTSPEEKQEYRQAHHKIVQETIRQYSKDVPIIQNMDFGHTDPQIAVPSGQKARISAQDRKIYFEY